MPLNPEVHIIKTTTPARLGWRRRQMALTVTLIGLGTFVTPLIGTDSEILGRTRWSPLQMILALGAGTLPIGHKTAGEFQPSTNIEFFMGVGVVYVLLGLVAAAILFLPSVRFVRVSTTVGVGCVLAGAKNDFRFLQEAIYGSWSYFAQGPQVHAGTNCLILLGVLGVLFWIAETKELD